MRIISRNKLREYWEKHADTQIPLCEWYIKTGKAKWKSLEDIRKDFNQVDYVGNQRYAFNIKGNAHRLIVAVKFTPGLVYIRFVGTHNEYDRFDAKNI